MYRTSFTDRPEDDVRYDGSITYEDSFGREFQKHLDSLDRFIFLLDMFRILDSCKNDLLSFEGYKGNDIWPDINKVLLNYLNAAFSLREYVNHYDPPLRKVTEKYYKKKKWYRFICDYRNSVIHQTVLIRDWMARSNKLYIDKDALILAQTDHILKKEANQDNQTSVDNAKRHLEVIKSLECDPDIKMKTGKNLVDMKRIVIDASTEIDEMKKEVLDYAYKKDIAPQLLWLLSVMIKKEDSYKYTFIYNEAYYDSQDWEKYNARCCEPNFAFEHFAYSIFCALGKDNPISRYIINFMRIHGYEHVYDKHCTPEEFLLNPHGGYIEQDI